MRQIRQMLRLARDGVSCREIARTLGIARSTVQDNLERAAAAGLAWPLPGEVTDGAGDRLFARAGVKQGVRRRPSRTGPAGARDARPGVNLMVLWEEYRAAQPGGYGYCRFCELYRGFERRLSPTMRQQHAAGDKVFVDYSGKKVGIVDPAHRHGARGRDLRGGARRLQPHLRRGDLDPDAARLDRRACPPVPLPRRRAAPGRARQPQGGVHKASFYDPEINRSYGMMASHYGVGVLPARPRKPRDKAKVENGVRFAQSYILGRLRRQTFFSLAEATPPSPRWWSASTPTSCAGSAPRAGTCSRPSSARRWRRCRATTTTSPSGGWPGSTSTTTSRRGLLLLGAPRPDPRAGRPEGDSRTVEVFHRGQRVAAHERRYSGRRHGTDPDHMPSAHRRYAEWTPERFRRWAAAVGPRPRGWSSPSWPTGLIPSRASGPVWASCACTATSSPAAPRPSRPAPSRSARSPTRASPRSWPTASAAGPPGEPAAVVDHANLRGPGYFH